MIRSVHIKNFRCLRDVQLELEPLTVLVGPNASGKSAILRALDPAPWAETDGWQHTSRSEISMRFAYDDGRVIDARLQQRRPNHRYQRLQLDVQQLRKLNKLERAVHLDPGGSNLTNVFGTLTRKQQEAFSRQFCRLVPMFRDLDTVPLSDGHHNLRFQDRWNPDVWYTPQEVSDGTLLVVAFLSLQYQSKPVDLVAIEEPERGLHPYLIGELIHLLRELATGAIGEKPIQVVLATHSAELLEFVRPEEVRFLNRIPEDGSVQVTRIDTASTDWRRAFREYSESLGSAWLAGGLSGVPGAEAAE
jgi:predicted ATPase